MLLCALMFRLKLKIATQLFQYVVAPHERTATAGDSGCEPLQLSESAGSCSGDRRLIECRRRLPPRSALSVQIETELESLIDRKRVFDAFLTLPKRFVKLAFCAIFVRNTGGHFLLW